MKRNIVLIITFIWLGFIGLIGQTIALREMLVVFSGNELCIGIIFAAWLTGIALGAGLASLLADRLKLIIWTLPIILLLITMVLPWQVYYIRTSRTLLEIPMGLQIPLWQTLNLSFLLVAPFSLLIGLAFPLACKIYAGEKDPARSISQVYVWEALGALLAGLVFTFWLVEKCHAFRIIEYSHYASLALLILIIWVLRIRARLKYGLILITAALLAGTLMTYTMPDKSDRFDKWTMIFRWRSIYGRQLQLVSSVDSKYGNLALGKLQDQYVLAENGQYVSSFPDDYTFVPMANLLMTQHAKPQRVLLIGNGIEGLVKEILKYQIETLDYVQPDRKLVELVAAHLTEAERRLLDTDKRLHIYFNDGRRFVKNNYTDKLYDLIIVNLPDPTTANLNRFYTVEFFKEAKARLNPGGVLATQCSSAVNYFGPEVVDYTGSVYDSLKSVFRQVLVTPGTLAYFFASDDPKSATFDVKTLCQRYYNSGITSPYFSAQAWFETLLEPQQIALTRKALEGRKNSQLNTDLRPITYFFNLMLWDKMTTHTTGSSNTFIKTLSKIRFVWIVDAILIIAIIWFGIRFIGRWIPACAGMTEKSTPLLSIFIIGLSGLSLELILILVFQDFYGYLYKQIGLLIALFMAGLAGGAFIANLRLARHPDDLNKYWLIHLALILLLLGLVGLMALLKITPPEALIYFFILIAGELTGLAYPFLSRIYVNSGGTIGRTAGLIDAFDHLGAALGALLTGVWLVPVFGIVPSCLILAILNLLTMIFIAIPLPQRYKIPK